MEDVQIKARAREYAAKLDLEDPEVKPGRVSPRVPMGLRVRPRRGRPVLIIGSRFGDLRPVEQEAMLAGVLTAAATFPGHLRQRALGNAVFVVGAGVTVGVIAGIFGRLVAAVPFVLLMSGWVVALAMSTRRFCYVVDRRVVETFGWPTIDVALDFDRRNPPRGYTLLLLIIPSVAQRMARLDPLRPRTRPGADGGRPGTARSSNGP